MNVTRPVRSGTRVELPAGVGRPFEVYVNGVLQREGADFRVHDRALTFTRELRQEGRLGFWRWTSILFGAAGTYRQNDVVDVIYQHAGQRTVAAASASVTPSGSPRASPHPAARRGPRSARPARGATPQFPCGSPGVFIRAWLPRPRMSCAGIMHSTAREESASLNEDLAERLRAATRAASR